MMKKTLFFLVVLFIFGNLLAETASGGLGWG